MATVQIDLQRQSLYRSRLKEKASILIIALWSLCLLVTYTVYLSYGVRQKIVLVQRLEERDKLHLVAEAGVKRTITEMANEFENASDFFEEDWNNYLYAFRDIGIGDGKFSICYEYVDKQSKIRKLEYGLRGEERKLNINKTEQEVLKRFFNIMLDQDRMKAQELAAAIVDWRDSDSLLSIPFGSAEDYNYRNFQNPYEAKDMDFEILEELLLVKGVSADIFDSVKDYLTVYGSGKVNINTAAREVLLSLGLAKRIVDEIFLFRYGEDGMPFTVDDNVFEADSAITPQLSQFSRLSASEAALLSVAVDKYLTTVSDIFEIRSVASLNNRKNSLVTRCVVNKSGKILRWRET